MKLSDLRGTIRAMTGNPKAQITLGSTSLTVPVQKTALLAALGDAFDGVRAAETGITLDLDTGLIRSESDHAVASEPAADMDLDDAADLDLDDDDFDL